MERLGKQESVNDELPEVLPGCTAELLTEEEWRKARATCIGGSEVAYIMGLSEWKGPVTVFQEKSGLVEEIGSSLRMRLGKYMEPGIRAAFEGETNSLLMAEIPGKILHLRSKSDDRWGFSPDGIILDYEQWPEAEGPGLLEMKHSGEVWDAVPDDYHMQVMSGLGVTGLKWGVIALMVTTPWDRDFRCYFVQRDEELISLIQSDVANFWDAVNEGNCPEPTFADLKAVKEAAGVPIGKREVDLRHLEDLDLRLVEVKSGIKSMTKKKEELEAQLIQQIGSAERAVISAGVSYTYKLIERKGYEVGPTKYRQLRRSAVKGRQ